MTNKESKVFGGLIGCIEIRGMDPSAARDTVLENFDTDTETVDKLLEKHWDYADNL